MVSKKTRREIEQTIFTPLMTGFLSSISPETFQDAINNDWEQHIWMQETAEGQKFLAEVRRIIMQWPKAWVSQAVEDMKDPNLIRWYVKNVMRKELPQYFVKIAYNPKGMEYLLKNWPKCLDVIW